MTDPRERTPSQGWQTSLGYPATTYQPAVNLLGRQAPGKRSMGVDVGRRLQHNGASASVSGYLCVFIELNLRQDVFVTRDQHPVPSHDNIRFDEVRAGEQCVPVGGKRVLGSVPACTSMGNHNGGIRTGNPSFRAVGNNCRCRDNNERCERQAQR